MIKFWFKETKQSFSLVEQVSNVSVNKDEVVVRYAQGIQIVYSMRLAKQSVMILIVIMQAAKKSNLLKGM
jgi:hypothetical protein